MFAKVPLKVMFFVGCAIAIPGAATAQAIEVSIASQPLGSALRSLAQQTNTNIIFVPEAVRGLQAPALNGRFSSRAGVERLLRNTGLQFRVNSDGTIVVTSRPRSRPLTRQSEADASRLQFAQNGNPGEGALRRQAALAEVQGAAAVETEDSEAIVVTANRRTQRLQDAPMSVGVVTDREIDREGLRSFADLARSVPGLVVTESGPGQNRIFMRGVANGNSSTSLIGIYLDEMPVTGSAFGQLDLQLVDLERIEVLRGPQGTLYGQGSAGGTIRFITREPELDAVSGRADVEAFTTEYGDASARLTGVVNIPIVQDSLGIRVSGTFAELGGWIDQPAAGREDINNQHLRDIRARALWTPLDGLRIGAFVVHHRNRGNGIAVGEDADHNVFFPNGDPLARERLVDDFNLYNATASYDFGPVTLLSSTSYTTSSKQADGYSVKLPDLVPGYETFNQDRQENEVFTQEVRLSSSASGPLSWVVGAYHTDERFERLLVINQYFSGASIGALPLATVDTSNAWSVFGDASYALTDRLQAGAGIRYFRDRRGQIAGPFDLDATFTSVDPRVYATFAVTPDVNVYANVASGFRSGGFAGDISGGTFGPENVWSYEAGVKGVIRQRLRFELTGFFSEYTDIQTFAFTTEILGGLVNSGKAHIRGVDAMVAYNPTDSLTLEASANVTDAELVEVLPTSLSKIAGDRVDFVPDYAFSISAEQRFDWAAAMPGFVRVDYNQVGRSIYGDRSAGVAEFHSDTLQFLNARVGLQRGNLSAELFAQNILNENGLQDPLAAFGLGSRPRPRVIGVRLGAGF